MLSFIRVTVGFGSQPGATWVSEGCANARSMPIKVVTFTATWGHGLLSRTISGSVVLPKLGFVMNSLAHVGTRVYAETWGLGWNLWPCWNLEAMLRPRPYKLG